MSGAPIMKESSQVPKSPTAGDTICHKEDYDKRLRSYNKIM